MLQYPNFLRSAAVFLCALSLYLFCLDPGASLWDCPEYILCAWRLEVGHPPGNPTWQLLANVVSHLGGSPSHAAVLINGMSAVSMALASAILSQIAYMLLRGSILHGGRSRRILANVGAACGALCYAWCDSAIFSAVEAEVYALSALLTALMLLLGLLYARRRLRGDFAGATRLFCLTFYLAGLGVGVHELNFLIIPALVLIYIYARKLRPSPVRFSPYTLILSPLLFLIGCTTYLIIPIRAAAAPPVNQGDPSTPERFLAYYARDQYGSKPLLYGRTPYSRPLILDGANRYYLRELSRGRKEFVYYDSLNMWFPRMTSSDQADIEFYEAWAGMTQERMKKVMTAISVDSLGRPMRARIPSYRPTYGQQWQYFTRYQLGYMYGRYLLWNFAGKQNSRRSAGGTEYGNFITGFPAADRAMLGRDAYARPDRGTNRYFLIPLLFGLAGIVALLCCGRRGRRVCAIVGLFFLFTGLAIVVYLNQDPGEPRERDYSFLGSYMAFAIWIACGMAALLKGAWHLRLRRPWMLFAVRALAGAVCVAVPLQMLTQTYDDHNRRHQKGAEAVAREFLAEVEPGAIVFAYGDNAIFPLWYVQEVLGWRRDVSVVALSYLSTDWYRRQLRIPGEGAPGLVTPDSIPAGTGTASDRVMDYMVRHNPGRPAYRISPASVTRLNPSEDAE